MSMYDRVADYWKAQAEANAKDAERYRFLRDNPWPSFLESIITLHQNGAWDAAIDLARAAAAQETQP